MIADRSHRDPVAPALRLVLTTLLACVMLAGCAANGVQHGGEPVTRKAKGSPKLSGLQEKIFEARDQSSVDVTEPYWPYRLGEIYAEADSVALAESALKSALRRDPSYAPALALLSKLYYDDRRHQDAVELLEAARSRSGPDGVPPALLGGLALHYEALGRHDLAAAVVASVQGSDAGKARSALVYVTLRGEHPAGAADPARAAVDDDPRSAANQNNYGLTRLRTGDPKAARDAFLKAIEIDPKRPGPYYNLAIVERFYFLDDAAAARWLKAYRERSNEDPDGLFKLFETKPVAEKGR
jgi:tetratricopeptide (TPR) repeat protein